MPTFAAVDIGSNSCRLKIAKVVAHQLKTLAEDREVTRLGASVFESGSVSPEAMEATLRALKRFQYALAPNSHLFLGSSESLGELQKDFTPVSARHKIWKLLRPLSLHELEPISIAAKVGMAVRGTPSVM